MMARVTERIGLGLTCSSAFNHPCQVARMLGSLGRLSGGRADGLLEPCGAPWDRGGEGALLFDEASGAFAGPAKIRAKDAARTRRGTLRA